ncbi:MAG TPA: glycosyltransferase family 4 protein [Tepidisphaeraceae bacterium]|jgi:glycosyltransferase involved in cell wall biosynthesis|nr:glycosyltransferase family 4 protein [Tepidisphaeraceae bacterium]
MRVFMLGWEFPPFISGGLGTACYGLTKAMSAGGTDIIFVLPRPVSTPFSTHVRVVSEKTPESAPPNNEFLLDEFEHVSFRSVNAQLIDPYQSAEDFHKVQQQREHVRLLAASGQTPTSTATMPARAAAAAPKPADHYSGDLFAEVQRYANLASEIGRREQFDVVHAHDWMTFPAGMAVAAARGVPLVVHVHSTEFDRSGVHIDSRIYDIERRGMNAAMKVIAVSYLTKNQVTHNYGIDASKVEVVYNAIEANGNGFDEEKYKIHSNEKIVLFLGRITHQKGPEYFLGAAKKVLEVMDNVKFVMAGSGDLTRRTIEMAAQMGIGHKVLFTGFLRGPDVDRVFKMADLYVMPSVSEPFGIAPLEAMSHDVPVLISKQSGVSEVLSHALKVDFWDTNEMANKIVAVLKHPPLASTLREHGSFEVRQLSWADAARSCVQVYDQAQAMVVGRN